MYFEKKSDILKIAKRTGCAIFVLPDDEDVFLKKALILSPEEKSVITIEQVRDVLARLNMRQVEDQFVIIRPADALGDEAANAMLKNLEEPGEKVHFVLITGAPSALLPTILSRAEIYFLKTTPNIDTGVTCDEKIKTLAKKLMTSTSADLLGVVEEICKKKDGVRSFALDVLAAAIEMLYKSYFITNKTVFVSKLPKFLAAYESISKNGHVKLQLIANLI